MATLDFNAISKRLDELEAEHKKAYAKSKRCRSEKAIAECIKQMERVHDERMVLLVQLEDRLQALKEACEVMK